VLTFADPEVIRMAREEFIPVAADDWYQRRRNDAEGEFFRKVADQGPRKGAGGSTRQGVYALTAGGKLLAYRNHHDPLVMRSVLAQALRAWRKLPEDQRKPGAVKVTDAGKADAAYDRAPPAGALIVSVYTRILDKTPAGEFCAGSCQVPGGDRSARDHLWLTEAEWKALLPASPRQGAKVAVPAALAHRLARFHLLDNTRGEPPAWRRQEVRSLKIGLTLAEVSDTAVTLRLEGSALLATAADPPRAARGYDARLLGWLRYDRKKRVFDRFNVVAVGEHWGESALTRRARPGRTPLGVAFELSRGEPADRVPPQGSRWLAGYLHADRQ
jgi:hypothetical protein